MTEMPIGPLHGNGGMKKTAIYTIGDLERAINKLFQDYPTATISAVRARLKRDLALWIVELKKNGVSDSEILRVLEAAKIAHPAYAPEFNEWTS